MTKVIRVEDAAGFAIDRPTTMPCLVDPPVELHLGQPMRDASVSATI